uniref:Fucolectin tachylectin-4 pentraxin-1 domain-containing protein n=1 Tax=Latimeria chalumnae TaxID=7897 RepID=H3ALS3_LATCH
NMARMGTATQSSTYENGIPGRANDGSKNTNYYGLSCSHTMADKRPWWRLDLKVSRAINIVVLTNRLDCCSERLKWVQVRIGDSLKNQGRICVTFSDVYSPGATVGFCCYGMKGRYVTVFIPNRREFLTLCEVEVLANLNLNLVSWSGFYLSGFKSWKSELQIRELPDRFYIRCFYYSTLLLHFIFKESPLPNMSGMGTATQSSVYKIGIAKHAIDGNKNGNHRKLSCSHTRADKSPWWRLDLQTTRTIMTVVITNRADCCSNRLRNVEVRVGNSLQNEGRDNYKCVPEKSATLPGATVRFCCYGASGRYVTVFIPNRREFLTLCEVEVFGILPSNLPLPNQSRSDDKVLPNLQTSYSTLWAALKNSSLQNIARMGTATQSSAYKNGIAKHAIDGNKNGNHRKLSCSHTRADRSPWWRLDLQTTRTIMTVVITNRADCCSNRLRNVEVRVGNSLQNEGRDNYKCASRATVRFCCYGASGRYVTVFIPNRREFLTLCEVEVFGILPWSSSLTSRPPIKYKKDHLNIARMGTATQSSEYKTGLAKHAIDGNKNTNHRQLSCSHTKADKSPWWRLDLQTTRTIMTVVLTNRVDCCSNRLRNVEVRVGNSLKNKFPVCGCASRATVGFCCYGASGRYVTVFIPNRREFLTLCEVEVFGILPC